MSCSENRSPPSGQAQGQAFRDMRQLAVQQRDDCRSRGGIFMDRIRIVGGRPLHGAIPISGAKNAALPLMIAGLLSEDTLILDNVPRLADVAQLQRILGNHGVDIMVGGKKKGETVDDGQTLHISAAKIIDTTAPY